MEHYDIGLLGFWYGINFGSVLTYYALYKLLEQSGYRTVLINKHPDLWGDNFYNPDSLANRFFLKENAPITPVFHSVEEWRGLNEQCESFALGSDVVWMRALTPRVGSHFFFDFVRDDKKKIAYAAAFGGEWKSDPETTLRDRSYLLKFDAVSVRENEGVRICRNVFGVETTQVMDPVFLLNSDIYRELSERSRVSFPEKYVCSYILHASSDKRKMLLQLQNTKSADLIVFANPNEEKRVTEQLGIQTMKNPNVEDWLKAIRGADTYIGDSYHGVCFSIIFRKNFILIRDRNSTLHDKFDTLLGLLGLESRALYADEDIDKRPDLLEPIDYDAVYAKLKPLTDFSMEWLQAALKRKASVDGKLRGWKVLNAAPSAPQSVTDIERCRMVAALLRDYGIRHVVLSSGARDVTLVRLFESNDCFSTHNVTDERSAAYYALGLALELEEPVAITCTSGTAVANYLPGITEAYHMQVPIAVVSGDRYPCFLEQMEAQKTNHIGALASVVKKSVDLPVNSWSSMVQWETRRLISDALLEMTHHEGGPVHINVPMWYLTSSLSPEQLTLPKLRHIDRIEISDVAMSAALDDLKRAKRILIISGQANPMSEMSKMWFDRFCDTYNCCVVTDHLSNLHNDWTINPYNLLRSVDATFFKTNLMPDLALYFGGKRVLNCPLQEKLRGLPRDYAFWRINKDGKVADLYYNLTHVFEMKPDCFFRYFAERSGKSKNDGAYYQIWKRESERFPQLDWRERPYFNAFYTIGKTFSKLPKNCMVHLGVGTSFHRAHYYNLDPSIKVHCNMGTNGIDGSASTFMGQALVSPRLSFLIIGDLSFFYDMNSIWNKPMRGNLRILLNNDGGAGFLKGFHINGITQPHSASAKGWVESLGFTYLSAKTQDEFSRNLDRFVSDEDTPMFFEAFIV